MRRVQPVSLDGVICLRMKISVKYGNSGLIQDQSSVETDLSEDQSKCFQNVQDNTSMSESDDVLVRITEGHKTALKNKYECLYEGVALKENQTLLNSIYTELYITEGESEGVNKKHEVLQIETASRTRDSQDKPISCNDIFKPLSTNQTKEQKKALSSEEPGGDRQKPEIRTVLTKGIAGIGKTVSVQKFILDWAEGRTNQNIDFILVLPFRELNLVKDDQFSLHGLLLEFHPELKDLDPKKYNDCKMLFIFDGLDESRLQLNCSERLFEVTKTSSVNILITNLIQGNLLPSALIWITSRPAAASQIPSQFISRVTEIQGFSDSQKEEYFRKRVSDESQANRIISHIKTSVSLHIMCHIPVFCWISATVLQEMLCQDNVEEIPKTLTEMYTHFLLIQTKMKQQKYEDKVGTDSKNVLESSKKIFLKLAKLAFNQLLRGNIMFYEEDLRECDIDVSEATVYSGICTEIFKEESVFRQKKVYCFVHMSVQEFFAALYVFYCYVNKNMEALEYFMPREINASNNVPLDKLLKKAVDKSLESKDGRLDLFVRFLHGISLESNQKLLQGLLTHTQNNQKSIREVSHYIKKLNKDGVLPERWINLLHCLTEMNDGSLHEEIQAFIKSENYRTKLSLAHCTALAYMFLMSEEVLDEFDLKKYNTSDEGHRRLVPAVRCCRKALLAGCRLTEQSCEAVASVLQSVNCPLRELDLSNNDLQDSGVKLVCAGLKNSHCKLEILRLAGCKLTEQSCEAVASVLQSVNCPLRELDLSNNDLQDSGVKFLCVGLKNPHCKLEILRCKQHVPEEILRKYRGCRAELKLRMKKWRCKLYLTSIIMGNVRSLANKTDELTALVRSQREFRESSIMCFTEIWLHEDIPDYNSTVTGFETIRADRDRKKSVQCFPNNKPWITRDIKALLNDKKRAFRAGDKEEIKRVQKALSAKIKEGKDTYRRRMEYRLQQNNTREPPSSPSQVPPAPPPSPLPPAITTDQAPLQFAYQEHVGVEDAIIYLLHRARSHLDKAGSTVRVMFFDFSSAFNTIQPVLLGDKLRSMRVDALLVTWTMDYLTNRPKYDLTLDPNTVNTKLSLSEGNRKVTGVRQNQSYPDHPERFDVWSQVMCRKSLIRRCYWETEWSGDNVVISVTYKGIRRKGTRESDDFRFGNNEKSWSLWCYSNSYFARHNKQETVIPRDPSHTRRVGVYLDWSSGTVSFYSVSSDTHTLTHLHTFHCTFTESLYAGFAVYEYDSSVSLCQIK
ncbi:protein NLRC3-like [Chanos chanos]|uniref:Protein NLRC3-like n=1 Tax=Chanos chanos TaxID=29144 RepID=A0A6J2WDC9_CHACN|nr:protein NLRC3-like [Chanos chanos]